MPTPELEKQPVPWPVWLLLQGSIADLAKPGGAEVRFEMNFIGAHNHGMYLDFSSTSVTMADSYQALHPALAADSRWNIGGLGLGYLYRKGPSEKKSLYFKVGLESGNMRIGYARDAFSDSSNYIALDAGIRYNVMFANVERGFWLGKYYYNLGLNSRYVNQVTFDSKNYSGFMNSLLFGVSVAL